MQNQYLNRIPYFEFDFDVTRSRGPGGQHVNRTNSAVVLRWNPANSAAFTEFEKGLLSRKLTLTESGDLLIRSEEFRSQDQNKSACLQKLERLLQRALHIPKRRIKTKPTRSSQRKRAEQKGRDSEIKKNRKRVYNHED